MDNILKLFPDEKINKNKHKKIFKKIKKDKKENSLNSKEDIKKENPSNSKEDAKIESNHISSSKFHPIIIYFIQMIF